MKINISKFNIEMAKSCLSQKEITESGISKSTMFRIRNGKDVNPKTVGKIAKALGCDVTKILADE